MKTLRSERPTRALRRFAIVASALGCACGDSDPQANAPFVPVLAYRGVVADEEAAGDFRLVALGRFAEQMEHLARNGYATATVADLAEYMRGERTLPTRAVVLTFDDAWGDAEEVATILDRHGLDGTFFVGVDAVTESELAALDWSALRRVAASPSFELGARPGRLKDGDDLVAWQRGETPGKGPLDVVWEVEVARQLVEEGLGHPVRSFAWPEGRISEELIQLARKAGYTALLTRRQRTNHAGGDPFSIGRYPVLGAFGLAEFQKLLDGAVRADVAELLAPAPARGDPTRTEDAGGAPPQP
jgi:peptidoglycan/xylan/chitin deacetylase (PgdA/CDA1 family)